MNTRRGEQLGPAQAAPQRADPGLLHGSRAEDPGEPATRPVSLLYTPGIGLHLHTHVSTTQVHPENTEQVSHRQRAFSPTGSPIL